MAITKELKTPDKYEYVLINNLCLFTKGPLSQWWGGFLGQNSTFEASLEDLLEYAVNDSSDIIDHLRDKQTLLGWQTPIKFNCCEQWMMACKAVAMDDVESFDLIMDEPHPDKQKALGRGIKNWDNDLWATMRYDVVLKGNQLKFSQNPELKEWLLSFHKQTLFAEASPWDKVWGIGLAANNPKALNIYKWEGLNLLGLVIQQVRRDLEPDGK
jgi:hypothetical protein